MTIQKLNENLQLTPATLIQSLYEFLRMTARKVNRMSGNEFTATYDPGSLLAGTGETTTVTAPNAQLGEYVLATFSQPLQGIILTAWVSAVGTVSVRFQNETGGTVDLASGTLKVRVSSE